MDQYPVYVTAAVIAGLVLSQVFRKGFDPFAPIWLFLVGYTQVYVVQALSYREWAVRVRGSDLVTAANLRALWALLWFVLVYACGVGRLVARRLPRPPAGWSPGLIGAVSPVLVAWGLVCAGMVLRQGSSSGTEISGEESLLRSFPAVMLVGGGLLLVTGRQAARPLPAFLAAGLAVSLGYVLIWMFNGKRSHSLLGVLVTVCALYTSRGKRPSLAVLGGTGCACAMVVSLAIGWRGNKEYESSAVGFLTYVADFRVDSVLKNLNMKGKEGEDEGRPVSYETEEYGGFLLMMDTVPEKSGYDYGAPYLRLLTTFIPRIVWPGKPLPGREQWIGAWVAGSEFPREANFTGPAIGILGAAQLNGGAWGTAIVMAIAGVGLRTGYEYFRLHAAVPWVQAWWALTYYNAWFMTVADDPLNWFYYNYGFTTMPPLALVWAFNKVAGPGPTAGIA